MHPFGSGGHRATLKKLVLSLHTSMPGVKFRSLVLVVIAFSYWGISLALYWILGLQLHPSHFVGVILMVLVIWGRKYVIFSGCSSLKLRPACLVRLLVKIADLCLFLFCFFLQVTCLLSVQCSGMSRLCSVVMIFFLLDHRFRYQRDSQSSADGWVLLAAPVNVQWWAYCGNRVVVTYKTYSWYISTILASKRVRKMLCLLTY